MTDELVEIIVGNENDLLSDEAYVELRAVRTKYRYLPESTCTEVTEEIPVDVYEEWHPGEPDIHPDADTPCREQSKCVQFGSSSNWILLNGFEMFCHLSLWIDGEEFIDSPPKSDSDKGLI